MEVTMEFRKIILSLFFLIPAGTVFLFSQENGFTVEGRINFKGNGEIHVCLVDEESFGPEADANQKLVYSPTAEEKEYGETVFRFENIKPGIYGIKGFLDVNGNGILDKGLFGPSEPWGMSWNGKKSKGPPDFRDIEFTVDSNIRNIDIVLK